jgi:Condensation domain
MRRARSRSIVLEALPIADMAATAFLLPASYTQEARLLRSNGGQVRDNVPMAWELDGGVSLTRLDRAIGLLAGGHESLRTALASIDGTVMQVVHPDARPRLDVVNVEAPRKRRWRQLKRIANDDAARPFDLRRPYPLRLKIVRLGRHNTVLLATATHAFWDGWSREIFLRDLDACYRAAAGETAPTVPDLPIQLGDFVAWQHASSDAAAEAYWACEPFGGWPIRNLPEAGTSAGPATLQRQRSPLASSAVVARLRSMVSATGTTLSTALLTAFAWSLHAATGRERLVVAVADANRDHEQSRALIGCLVDYVFVGTHVPAAVSFRSLLAATHRSAVTARKQKLPLERLLPSPTAMFGAGGKLGCDGPFDIGFNDLSHFDSPRALTTPQAADAPDGNGGLRLRPLDEVFEFDQPSDAYWHRTKLSLVIQATASGGLESLLIYRGDRVAADLVATVGRELEQAVRRGAFRPDATIPSGSYMARSDMRLPGSG